MSAGEPVLEAIFEVDANGILKVTAVEKSTGKSANITISNSVGRLSSDDIEKMVNQAEEFKAADEAFAKRHEAKQHLESYISQIEATVSDPTVTSKVKRGGKEQIESCPREALGALEIKDAYC